MLRQTLVQTVTFAKGPCGPAGGCRVPALSFSRRSLLFAPALLAAPRAWAQAFPEKPIRLIVPFTPGGATDGSARVVAEFLSAHYGKPVVVENRPGAAGTVAAELVARSAPDGHTWLIGSAGTLAIAPFLMPGLSYDTRRDLAPVSLVFTTDHVMTVNPRLAVRDVAGFIAHAKAQPRPLSFASSGNGTSLHLIGELFRLRAGIELIHAPYRGSAPAVNDLIAGNVDCMFDQLPASIAQVRGGALRALALTGPRRNLALPDVPIVAETIPGFEAQSWNGMAVQGATPPALVRRIADDIALALGDAAVKARLAPFGADYSPSTPAGMAAVIEADRERWGPVIRGAGITAT